MSIEQHFSSNDNMPPFQPEITYKNPADNPVAVAATTTNIIDQYFAMGTYGDWEANFLANQATDLVYSARKGFLYNLHQIKDVGKVDPNILNHLWKLRKPLSNPDIEDTESFARLNIAFGILPEVASHPLLPDGFSRRQMLEPPFGIYETYNRIKEIELYIGRVKNSEVDPRITNILNEPGLFRTYLAFQTVGSMPIRNPLASNIEDFRQSTLESLKEKFANPKDR